MIQSFPLLRSRNRSGQIREHFFFFVVVFNDFSQDSSELLGSLPYKGNANDHHPDHNPLDANKVNFKKEKFLEFIETYLASSLIAQ